MNLRHRAVYLKLGGALLTQKGSRETLRPGVLQRLAVEIAGGRERLSRPLVLAHGSGSFAHMAVHETGFDKHTADPLALARVSAAARRLDTVVVDALVGAGVPALAVPGSVIASLRDGRVIRMRGEIVSSILEAGMVPVLYGDGAVDQTRGGGVASTEMLITALCEQLPAGLVVMATDVDGVLDRDPSEDGATPIAHVVPGDWQRLARILVGPRPGTMDYTGGMAGKVRAMLDLVQSDPAVRVRLVSGLRPGAVTAAMADLPEAGGSLITAHR